MSPPPNNPPTDTDQEVDLSGHRLGDYLLIRQLGSGGMSLVYLAEQVSLQRHVALKVLKRRLSEDASYVRRFHREAQAAAKLVHANIVQIFEVGECEGRHYIAQEYVAGRNLKQVLEREGVLKALPAVGVLRRVLSALRCAGEAGITHRDIKPENIMIAPNGDVKVADFGLARIEEETGVNLTQIGVTMGTPLYMSPEQIEGRDVDHRSDLYSLGVTCYHMLVGRAPFLGETPLSIAVQHLKDAPTRLESLRKDLPEGLCRIVHRLLEKAPTDRYGSAAEAMRALRGVPVEGGAEEWSDHDIDGDDLGAKELAALYEDRNARTQRLNLAMLKSERSQPWRRGLVQAALVVLSAGLLGAAGGWQSVRPLLSPVASPAPPAADGVLRMETAELQYLWAIMPVAPSEDSETPTPTPEDMLLSVERFFSPDKPEDRFYIQSARLRLGEHYLELDRFEEALERFQQAATSEDDALKLKATSALLLATWRQTHSLSDAESVRLLNESKRIVSDAPPPVRMEIFRYVRDLDEPFFQVYGRTVFSEPTFRPRQPPPPPPPDRDAPPKDGPPRGT